MGGVAQRFVFINVDRGHPWVSGIERYHWRANERRAAVTMPRVGSTSRMCKVSKSGLFEECLFAGGVCVTLVAASRVIHTIIL